jgi:hypothetical protein
MDAGQAIIECVHLKWSIHWHILPVIHKFNKHWPSGPESSDRTFPGGENVLPGMVAANTRGHWLVSMTEGLAPWLDFT